PEGDPAAGRSDHASFQAHGYPACVVSEDFFVGPGPDAPVPEENPNYHRPGDTFVDEVYAADITRAIAAAAWTTASQPVNGNSLTSSSFSALEQPMSVTREFDSRKKIAAAVGLAPTAFAASTTPSRARTNTLTGTPVIVSAPSTLPTGGSLVERALSFVHNQ